MSDYYFQPFLPDFYRTPSAKTLLFLEYYKTVYGLLSDKEKTLLSNRSRKGRTGYTLFEIFGIMMLKQIYGVPTIKATLQLLEDNQNLCTILNIEKIPSEATVSRLSGRIESFINISCLTIEVGFTNPEKKKHLKFYSAMEIITLLFRKSEALLTAG